jgi:hypothetical protein
VENVEHLAACGRARWELEKEHNNELKNRGYNLEHNFGHGKNHAAELFFLVNLLTFQFHTILELVGEVDLAPSGRQKDKCGIQQQERTKKGKKTKNDRCTPGNLKRGGGAG